MDSGSRSAMLVILDWPEPLAADNAQSNGERQSGSPGIRSRRRCKPFACAPGGAGSDHGGGISWIADNIRSVGGSQIL
jgi:hypothetical protein